MTENNTPDPSLWRFLDGAASISASMLLAVAFNVCYFCDGVPVLRQLEALANREDGIIITATLLLFPTTASLYGVLRMFFAAKQAAERKARERGRREGIQEGLQEGIRAGQPTERARISATLQQHGVELSPELAKILAGDDE